MKIFSDKRILLVEDNLDSSYLTRLLLVKYGADVDVAMTGDEGVEKALTKTYDLVLMDMRLPETSGYEATQMLRRVGYSKPIIALTASVMAEEKEKSFQAGCDDFVPKPIDFEELVSVLTRWLNNQPANSTNSTAHTPSP